MSETQTEPIPKVPDIERPEIVESSVSEPLLKDPPKSETNLVWKIVEQFRKAMISRQIQIAIEPKWKATEATAAFKAVLAASKQYASRRKKRAAAAAQTIVDETALEAALAKLRTEMLNDVTYLDLLRNRAADGNAGPVRADG